ncbi:uncharacterized protein AB675_2627 [Cyphellophora attinorum]|uniref:Uncharacterized protein n=1 Tax=Cyphellophora attinorum TaxID=1664694 RepID=A0A0N1P334_9EURO|nr:uncharacterized protein AB675_2627 [Phialophora attinorum]KPI44886.1 hypothetical protein AB675_2627 [Phialophora attinorum]
MSGARHNFPDSNPSRRSSASHDGHRGEPLQHSRERYSNFYDVDDRQTAPHRSVPRSIPGSRHADIFAIQTLDDADSNASESTSSNADSDGRYASLVPETRQFRRSRAIAGDEDSPWSSVNVRGNNGYSRAPSNDTYAADVPRHSAQQNPRKSQSQAGGASDNVDKYYDSRAETMHVQELMIVQQETDMSSLAASMIRTPT